MREAYRIMEARKQLKMACEHDGADQRNMVLIAWRQLNAWLSETRPDTESQALADYEGEASRAG